MCYTVKGRLHTRLVALILPILYGLALLHVTGDQDYSSMLLIMVLVAFDLDLFVYPHIFTYQSRWQTYLVGIGELLLMLAVVRILGSRYPLDHILAFYLPAWIAGLLVSNVAPPILDPMWMEHGGEIGRAGIASSLSAERRRSVLSTPARKLLHGQYEYLLVIALAILVVISVNLLPSTLTLADCGVAVIAALAVRELLAFLQSPHVLQRFSRRHSVVAAPSGGQPFCPNWRPVEAANAWLSRAANRSAWLFRGKVASVACVRAQGWPPLGGATTGDAVPMTISLSRADTIALALLVSLLLRGNGLHMFAIAGVLSVLVACWVRFEGHPLLNPAAAAFVATVLLIPGAYAADQQWGNSALFPLLLGNVALLLALRSARLPLVLAYILTVGFANLAVHGAGSSLTNTLVTMMPTALIFFGGFVAPERGTSPQSRLGQISMGLFAGLGGVVAQQSGIGMPFAVALLVVNYGACMGSFLARLAIHSGRRPATDSDSDGTGHRLPQSRPVFASRRSFLAGIGALGTGLALGGGFRRLSVLDAATLDLPSDPALEGGHAIPRFVNAAAQSQIALSHHIKRDEGSPSIGTGAAWGDFDRDGRLDLFVTDHVGASHLYRNNGDGTFTDVAKQAGVAHQVGRATSATFVDYNNDGWPDLYVGTAFGTNILYHNNGDGTFTDVSSKSGLADPGRTMSTAWADYDGDGYLDVFVANYADKGLPWSPNNLPLVNQREISRVRRPQNSLYHNNGDGTFTEVTHHLLGFESTAGFGFSAVWFDYNNDGRPDLYVAYDFGWVVQPNTFWRNDGPDAEGGWQFTQVQKEMGVAAQISAMGTVAVDYDNDGWIDVAVSNIGPDLVYHNESGLHFVDVARGAGVSRGSDVITNMMNPVLGWGLSLADFNNDGWPDLYLVQGTMDFEPIPQPNRMFVNDHTGGFIDVSDASGANDRGRGRSLAVADYDGDGYLDMFVANYGQAPVLYRNVSAQHGNRYHWLRLQLEGTQSNRDAVGARVHVFATGLPAQTREVQLGQGLGSCDDKTLHFGLGAVSQVDKVEIRWPSGRVQILRDVGIDEVHKIREPGASRWRD